MKPFIYCQNKEHGFHTFYLKAEGRTYFLFTQGYHSGVQNYFGNGVTISEAMDHKRAHRDNALERTMTKMPAYIRYIEREYGIGVLNQTKKSDNRSRKTLSLSCA